MRIRSILWRIYRLLWLGLFRILRVFFRRLWILMGWIFYNTPLIPIKIYKKYTKMHKQMAAVQANSSSSPMITESS